VDKFEGDAIMAEFGAPVPFAEHAREACLAALEMQALLRELGEQWAREGLHPWRSRVGVHTGNVIVGNMGSRTLFDYTVIGDNVNLGARLESSNKIYGTRIMVSDATLRQAGPGLVARELDDILVKGKTHPVKVFELVAARAEDLPPPRARLLEAYHRGLEAERDGRFREAAAAYEEALAIDPGDGPSLYHHARVLVSAGENAVPPAGPASSRH
jgi:adenylate cyclase